MAINQKAAHYHLRKRYAPRFAVLLAVVLLAFAPNDSSAGQRNVSLTVSAAISLKDALDQIGAQYENTHPGLKIRFNFGGSGTLQHQIEQGAPVDIFFSAARQQMDALASENLIDPASRHTILSNSLVLIAPVGSSSVHRFADLAKPIVKVIALGEPATVPAGQYSAQALEHLGFASVEKKAVYAKDVRQVLTYVATGNADAGIVYKTDAEISSKVRVIAIAPSDSHDPIVYPAAVLRNSQNPAAAKAFLEFLDGPDAQAVFQQFGFAPAERNAEGH